MRSRNSWQRTTVADPELELAGGLTVVVAQRSTLVVSFGGGLTITGGSNTGGLQADPVTDLTLQTTSNSNPSWLTAAYTGFSYTPKQATYNQCGTVSKPGSNCSFAFYAIDPATLNSAGTQGKACRFTMMVSVDPMLLPDIDSTQLYADYSGASLSTSKAPLALLALLAVPALFLVAF